MNLALHYASRILPILTNASLTAVSRYAVSKRNSALEILPLTFYNSSTEVPRLIRELVCLPSLPMSGSNKTVRAWTSAQFPPAIGQESDVWMVWPKIYQVFMYPQVLQGDFGACENSPSCHWRNFEVDHLDTVCVRICGCFGISDQGATIRDPTVCALWECECCLLHLGALICALVSKGYLHTRSAVSLNLHNASI